MGKEIKWATTSKAFYKALKNDFPEVETATIINNFHTASMRKENGESHRAKISGISPDFFDVFDVNILKGNVDDLNKPITILISSESAIKFVGNDDPIGKTLTTGMDRENKKFTIVGIVEKLPQNSHFDFDMLFSNTSASWFNISNNWLNGNFHNYVVLKPNTNHIEFEKKFNKYAMERIAPIIENWHNLTIKEWHEKGDWVKFVFHPIRDIHLITGFDDEYNQHGNLTYIYIFIIVGILILLISIINFSNLSTVKSLSRTKEIAVKKVSGSTRKSLIVQYLVESCFLSLIALFIAIVIIVIISPYFNNFSGVNILTLKNFKWYVLTGIFALSIISGLLSGAFPALYLSGLSPVKTLSSSGIKFKGILLKDVLIVAQFVISISVITSTFIISKQLNFLQNEKLGFKKDNIIVIKGTSEINHSKNILFNKELQKLSTVINSSSSQNIPNSACSSTLFTYN